MAAETPVLERRPEEKLNVRFNPVQSYMDCFNEEEDHNARIRDRYARLINPDCRIEDIIQAASQEEVEEVIVDNSKEEDVVVAPVVRPYLVENARADSAIFRADSPINRAKAAETVEVDRIEEDDEDLRPTATTIQYQTIAKSSVKSEIKATSERKMPVLGRKEKIVVAVFVGIVLALLTLVIVNSSIIANLTADLSTVQNEITTVRGALAGVNATVSEIVPETIRNLIIK